MGHRFASKASVKAALVILLCAGTCHAGSEWPNGSEFKGREVFVDLPTPQRVQNIRAPRDGQGLCVFASLEMCAHWENIPELKDLIHKIPNGGGWPQKVDQVMKQLAPGVQYVQYQGSDPTILERALAIGRPPCITYGYGDFYRGQTIAHMVLLVHLDQEYGAIIDNNDPGHVTWMTRAELLARWVHPRGVGWTVVLLAPPPPLPPKNQK
jgi:hypothetical protein